jgi:uncharacterized membrane protein YobD (UPF0266 family)
MATKDREGHTVVSATEARQGRITGMIYVLIIGVVLAATVGGVFLLLGNS